MPPPPTKRQLDLPFPGAGIDATPSTTSSPSPTASRSPYDGLMGSTVVIAYKSYVIAVAAICVALILLCLISWLVRRRKQDRTWRQFVLPNGLQIKWLRLNIKAPPPYVPPTPEERAVRRIRRPLTTAHDLGSGGRRAGNPDPDDVLDAQSVLELPEYTKTSGVPTYNEAWRNGRTDLVDDEGDAVREVEEYEARTRIGAPPEYTGDGDIASERTGTQTESNFIRPMTELPPRSQPRLGTIRRDSVQGA